MTDPVLPPGMSPTGASHSSGQGSPSAPGGANGRGRQAPSGPAARRHRRHDRGRHAAVGLVDRHERQRRAAREAAVHEHSRAGCAGRSATRGAAGRCATEGDRAALARPRAAQRRARRPGQGNARAPEEARRQRTTPLPPPPVAAPAARPSFGPDRPGTRSPDAGPQRFRRRRPCRKAPCGALACPPPAAFQHADAHGHRQHRCWGRRSGKGAKPARTRQDATPALATRAAPTQRRLHPRVPPGGLDAHRRQASATRNRCCCASRQRDPAEPVPPA